jgi:hypothetical protein
MYECVPRPGSPPRHRVPSCPRRARHGPPIRRRRPRRTRGHRGRVPRRHLRRHPAVTHSLGRGYLSVVLLPSARQRAPPQPLPPPEHPLLRSLPLDPKPPDTLPRIYSTPQARALPRKTPSSPFPPSRRGNRCRPPSIPLAGSLSALTRTTRRP